MMRPRLPSSLAPHTLLPPTLFPSPQVKRWTTEKKVKGLVFSKDMLIVPIHCHGNHWTRECHELRTFYSTAGVEERRAQGASYSHVRLPGC